MKKHYLFLSFLAFAACDGKPERGKAYFVNEDPLIEIPSLKTQTTIVNQEEYQPAQVEISSLAVIDIQKSDKTKEIGRENEKLNGKEKEKEKEKQNKNDRLKEKKEKSKKSLQEKEIFQTEHNAEASAELNSSDTEIQVVNQYDTPITVESEVKQETKKRKFSLFKKKS
ncbi:MAG: hypothetical protein ACK40G_01295 [Cytophagaceae bacterium]